jgi:hypothetical protein
LISEKPTVTNIDPTATTSHGGMPGDIRIGITLSPARIGISPNAAKTPPTTRPPSGVRFPERVLASRVL